MNLTAWCVPVNAYPDEVRRRSVGETRPMEPTEARRFLPIPRWPDPKDHDRPVKLAFSNGFYVDLGDARHYTALGFPA